MLRKDKAKNIRPTAFPAEGSHAIISTQDAIKKAVIDVRPLSPSHRIWLTYWQGFTALTPAEVKEVSKNGTARKWIEGKNQTVSWANSTAQLLRKTEGDWEEIKIFDSNMKGFLPRDWALEFSRGKVKEG